MAEPADEAANWGKGVASAANLLASVSERDVAVGETAKTLISSFDRTRCFHFDRPKGVEATLGPVLLVHGLVGRYTIADLQPDRSAVGDLLARGIDMFVIDWGYPGRSDRFLDLDDHINGYLDAHIDEVLAQTGASSLTLLGICEGGVFCICYAALHPEKVSGLITTITPVDCHADKGPNEGFLNLWLRSLAPQDITEMIDAFGNLPGPVMGSAFQAMAPRRALTKYNIDLMAAAGDADDLHNFLRMEKWLGDRPDHPGAAAKEMLVQLYNRNDLVAGRFMVGGKTIDLANLTMPVLNIFALSDHIVPPACARVLGDHVGTGDYTEIALPCGHVGVFVSSRTRGVVGERVANWMKLRA